MPFIFEVKVVPSSGQNKWILDKNGTLKCYLKSAPEKGKANKELIQLISKVLKIPQSDVAIVSGATDRRKKISITLDLTFDQLLEKVGIVRDEVKQQISMF